MQFRKKKQEDIDPATKRLLESGVIRINQPNAPPTATQKIKEFGMVTYDFWSGVKYIIVLTALLWWLPLFGPMLAGYVGGRRTGGPNKGLMAAITGIIVIAAAYFIYINALLPTFFSDNLHVSGAVVASLSNIQLLAPYINFMELYWGSFFTSILGGLPYSPNSYIITIIFAYVGGIITVDKQREIMRAENGLSPSIMVNVPAFIPYAREQAPVRARGQRQASAPVRNRSFQDMKRINMNRPPQKTYQQIPVVKRQDEEQKTQLLGSRLPKRSVKHHSSYESEDWELL